MHLHNYSSEKQRSGEIRRHYSDSVPLHLIFVSKGVIYKILYEVNYYLGIVDGDWEIGGGNMN